MRYLDVLHRFAHRWLVIACVGLPGCFLFDAFDDNENQDGTESAGQQGGATSSESADETAAECMPVYYQCEDDSQCCTGHCDEGTCMLLEAGGACMLADECQSGRCEDGACVCIPENAACENGIGCCENTRCENDGSGQLACLPCGLTGDECSYAGECCGDACVLGVCNSCRPMGEACVLAAECCGGLGCVEGACDMCRTAGGGCVQDGDCCSLECVDGGCTCREIGETCDSSEQCCSGSCNGTCDEGSNDDGGGGGCSPDGAPCITSSNCCDGQCVYLFPYFFCA